MFVFNNHNSPLTIFDESLK